MQIKSFKLLAMTVATIIAVIFVSNTTVYAEQISGRVLGYDENNRPTPLNRARIAVMPANKGTLTDASGRYNLTIDAKDEFLIISFLGYQTDTIQIAEIENKNDFTIQMKNIMLDAITVGGDRVATQLSFSDGVRSQTITTRGLQKAACCNLSEAFLTTPAVDVEFTDAVTGAKRIQLLGLQGVYSQIQAENMPIMRGLASNYGFGLVPGQWLDAISISKGASTVKNGFESISGLIDVNFKQPDADNPTFINLYMSDVPHPEINADHTIQFSDKFGTMFFVHANGIFNEIDHNNDGFLDKPMGHQINFFNRWDYAMCASADSKWGSSSGFGIVNDLKKGGQMGYHKNNDNSNNNDSLWGMKIKTERYNVYTKNGFRLNDEGMNIGTILSFIHHKQEASFGNRFFNGEQNSLYANMMFQQPQFKTSVLTVGASLQYDNYVQKFQNNPFLLNAAGTPNNANIVIPGIFAEYSMDFFEGFKVVAGLRGDFLAGNYNYNNDGIDQVDNFISPRLHLKYNIFEDVLTVAGSVGRGYRIARVIEENSGYLASNREFVIFDNLRPEEAWNYGVNMFWTFKLLNVPFDLNADFYRTDFVNQVVIDLDKDQNSVYFYNLAGKSYSNSFQIDLTAEPLKNFYITAAYRINDVKVTTDGKLQDKVLQSKQKSFVNLQYNTDSDNEWAFDFTVDYNGSGRLPKIDDISKTFAPFILLNAQITKTFGDLDIYIGGENLTDYKISDAIRFANTPFAKGFDASMIYGPVMGRHLYAGIRYHIW